MHTYSDKVIDSSKISLLKNKDEYSASKILKQLIDDNILYVKQNLDFLYEYYNYLDLGQVFRHIFLRIFINYSSFAGAVDINIKENL